MPEKIKLENRSVLLRPIAANDLDLLYESAGEEPAETFHHMFFGPFDSKKDMKEWITKEEQSSDKITFSIYSKRLQRPVGTCSLLNTDTNFGTSEIGSIWYCRSARRTEINTNTVYLLLCYLFEELKYRRVVWKCDNTNEPSKRAALQLGFKHDGLFRKHMIIKNRNRDTAWYSMIDDEWTAAKSFLIQRIKQKESQFLSKQQY